MSVATPTWKRIVFAGTACGVMDITAALVVYGQMGLPPLRLLQGVAAGLVGRSTAYAGGFATAALGLFCHFVVAFGAATVFVLASRKLRFLVSHTALTGPLYGILVYFFMNRIVVPLSAIGGFPFSVKSMLIGCTIHIFCVGLPIAIATRLTAPRAEG